MGYKIATVASDIAGQVPWALPLDVSQHQFPGAEFNCYSETVEDIMHILTDGPEKRQNNTEFHLLVLSFSRPILKDWSHTISLNSE